MSRRHNNRQNKARNTTTTFEGLEDRRMFAAGAPDWSFAGGTTFMSFGPGVSVKTTDVAVQADGKTVVVGTSSDNRFAVARFNLDGSPDTTFGPDHDGKVLTRIGAYNGVANAVAIQSNGKIVVAGAARKDSPTLPSSWVAVARYMPDGSLDKYFGNTVTSNGIAITAMGTDEGLFGHPEAAANDVAIAPDGKIVVAGYGMPATWTGQNDDFMVARFKSNGELDGSFGDSGHRFIGFGGYEYANALAIDLNGSPASNPKYYGSIVLAGYQGVGNGKFKAAIARVYADGNVAYGKRLFNYQGKIASRAESVVIQPDSKIVIAGCAGSSEATYDFAMARFKPDGAADTSFGGADGDRAGSVVTSFSGPDRAYDIARNMDGELLVCGLAEGKFAIEKFSAQGVLDRSFGTGGRVLTSILNNAGFSAIATGPGRRFVAAGGDFFQTARYLDSGANLVTLGTFNPKASEQGPKSTAFIVGRTERLSVPTRVYLKITGTAAAPHGLRGTTSDYTLDGVTFPLFARGRTPYVDIPANQTFVVVTLTPRDDTVAEGPETATFTILPSADFDASYDLGNPAGTTITIADNDSPQASSGLRRSLGSTTRKVHDDSLFSNDLIAGLV
jgi:uncharacterized delta-60 repeat protein